MSRPNNVGPKAPGPGVTRDQRFALHAYASVASVERGAQKDYKIAVHDFGTNVLRGGLAAAAASLERRDDGGVRLLRQHLAKASVVGLQGADAETLPGKIRELDVDDYIMATRELLHLSLWLKRAVQAIIKEPSAGSK